MTAAAPQQPQHFEGHDIEGDAFKVVDCLAAGGVALVPTMRAFALMAHTPQAIQRVYDLKSRTPDRPSSMVGSRSHHRALQIIPDENRALVDAIIDSGMTLGCIGGAREDHPYFQLVPPEVRRLMIKDGGLSMLMNAGPLRERVGQISWDRQMPIMGTSANLRGRGGKFHFEDIEPEVIAACDLTFNYGSSDPRGIAPGSTMIDFRTLRLLRKGYYYEEIKALAERMNRPLVS